MLFCYSLNVAINARPIMITCSSFCTKCGFLCFSVNMSKFYFHDILESNQPVTGEQK